MTRTRISVGFTRIQRVLDVMIYVCFVGKPPLVDPDRFGETVALNRGATVGVFESLEEGEAWIQSQIGTGS